MLLTTRQVDVLRYVRDFREEHAIAPTLAEIAEHFGVSKITIHEHLDQLEGKGAIRRARGRARAIEVLWDPDGSEQGPGSSQLCHPLPVAGTIAAGVPMDAVQELQEFRLDELIPPQSEIFLLRVRGDSMIEDHICDGDMVLVEPRRTARNGETVVALLEGGEDTLKRYYRERGLVRLQPANPDMPPLYLDQVQIQGVVIGVIRRFGITR